MYNTSSVPIFTFDSALRIPHTPSNQRASFLFVFEFSSCFLCFIELRYLGAVFLQSEVVGVTRI